MVIALLGPSCCGKSHLLRVLRDKLDAYVPIGITTRPKRLLENGELEHLSVDDFLARKKQGMLSFAAEVFGHHYAYPRLPVEKRLIAIEIVRENIPELRSLNGLAIKIMPPSLEIAVQRVEKSREFSAEDRKNDLMREFQDHDANLFDHEFVNHYDDRSADCFLDLIRSIIG